MYKRNQGGLTSRSILRLLHDFFKINRVCRAGAIGLMVLILTLVLTLTRVLQRYSREPDK